jgi:Arm DNA-binding domain
MGRFVRIGFDRIDAKYIPKYTPGMILNKTKERLRPGAIPKLVERVGSHHDGGSLYLVVRRPGSGAWVFQFRDGPKLRSKGLGAFPAVSLAMARKKRADALASHDNEPEKPKGAGQSFAKLSEQYFDHHAAALGPNQLTRTLATWAQEQRRKDGSRLFDQETIDGALAHFVGGTTGVYQRSKHLEARRKLLAAWSRFVCGR